MQAKHAISFKGSLTKKFRPLSKLIKDTSGNTLIMVGLAMPVVLGMAALGLDSGLWYMQKRQMQAIADNAVLAGVYTLQQGGSASEIQQAVIDHAAFSGFQNGVDGHVTVNNPPSAGPNAADPNYVEVFVEQNAPTMLSVFQRQGPLTIQTRAVASLVSGGNYCVVSLAPSGKHMVDFAGASTATLNSCAISANSDHADAIRATGGSLTADAMQAVGGIDYDASVSLTYGPPREGAPPVTDPHADLTVIPDPSTFTSTSPTCVRTNYASSGDETLPKGRYCGGLSIGSGDVINFDPGVYLITEGDFFVSAGAELHGTDVTIIITGQNTADIGKFKINGHAVVDLTAPGPAGHTYGPYSAAYPGILVYVDPRSPAGDMHIFNGGSDMTMEGAIYVPGSEVQFGGGANVTVGCLQVIARKVTFTGNSYVTSTRDDCGALGVKTAGSHMPRIAE